MNPNLLYTEIDKTNPLWRARYDAGYEQAIEDTKDILKSALKEIEKLKKTKGIKFTITATTQTNTYKAL